MVACSGIWQLFNNLYDLHRKLKQPFFKTIPLLRHLFLQSPFAVQYWFFYSSFDVGCSSFKGILASCRHNCGAPLSLSKLQTKNEQPEKGTRAAFFYCNCIIYNVLKILLQISRNPACTKSRQRPCIRKSRIRSEA